MKKKIQNYHYLLSVLTIFLSSCATDYNIAGAKNTEINKQRERANENYEEGFYKKAEVELRWIIKQDPNDADSHYKLGVIYGKQGLGKKSCHEFLKTISINPDYARANYNMGVLLLNNDSVCSSETAAYFFKKYLTLDPSSEHRETIERWFLKNEKQVYSEERPKSKKITGLLKDYPLNAAEKTEEPGFGTVLNKLKEKDLAPKEAMVELKEENEIPSEISIKKNFLKMYENPALTAEIIAKVSKGGNYNVLEHFQPENSTGFFLKIKLKNEKVGWVYEPENR